MVSSEGLRNIQASEALLKDITQVLFATLDRYIKIKRLQKPNKYQDMRFPQPM